jgi:hypothetical protein
MIFGEYHGALPCLVVCVPESTTLVQAEISGWSLRVTGAYPFAHHPSTINVQLSPMKHAS